MIYRRTAILTYYQRDNFDLSIKYDKYFDNINRNINYIKHYKPYNYILLVIVKYKEKQILFTIYLELPLIHLVHNIKGKNYLST